MVITTNDSCNTLFSLDADIKNRDPSCPNNVPPDCEYIRTDIYLPVDDSSCSGETPVYLPLTTRVDHYLKKLPQVTNACNELLSVSPRVFNKHSKERIVYVGQGEVAHSRNSQCDVLVSDRATTCHILAFRSKLNGNDPLTSLTHVDGTSYESCIRAMVGEHLRHHQSNSNQGRQSEGKNVPKKKIDFEIHVMGGFDDADSSSLKISAWLMGLLVRIANEQKESLRMILKTCAISAMNDNGNECPIGRGLGVDLHSGEVFLAKVEEEVAGPEVCLRSVRLWSSSAESRQLSLIHSSHVNEITIFPFRFEAFEYIKQLLKLPDEVLIQYTSTSPDVEETGFCASIRGCMQYLMEQQCEDVFGPAVNKPLVYQRAGRSNSWTRRR
eukprot:scaffold14008_cov124-Cylindrotheca_fusiformis.AAC.6